MCHIPRKNWYRGGCTLLKANTLYARSDRTRHEQSRQHRQNWIEIEAEPMHGLSLHTAQSWTKLFFHYYLVKSSRDIGFNKLQWPWSCRGHYLMPISHELSGSCLAARTEGHEAHHPPSICAINSYFRTGPLWERGAENARAPLTSQTMPVLFSITRSLNTSTVITEISTSARVALLSRRSANKRLKVTVYQGDRDGMSRKYD